MFSNVVVEAVITVSVFSSLPLGLEMRLKSICDDPSVRVSASTNPSSMQSDLQVNNNSSSRFSIMESILEAASKLQCGALTQTNV